MTMKTEKQVLKRYESLVKRAEAIRKRIDDVDVMSNASETFGETMRYDTMSKKLEVEFDAIAWQAVAFMFVLGLENENLKAAEKRLEKLPKTK